MSMWLTENPPREKPHSPSASVVKATPLVMDVAPAVAPQAASSKAMLVKATVQGASRVCVITERPSMLQQAYC